MICWADGGWNHFRGIGYASVFLDTASTPTVMPVFNPTATPAVCEAQALLLAILMVPDSPSVEIRMDSLTVVELVLGPGRCTVLELLPYIRWARRELGSRKLVWVPRNENLAHVTLSSFFEDSDSWNDYELAVLRERKRQS